MNSIGTLRDFRLSGADGFAAARFTTSTGAGGAPTFTTSSGMWSITTGATGAFSDTACVLISAVKHLNSFQQFDWTMESGLNSMAFRVTLRGAGNFNNTSTPDNGYVVKFQPGDGNFVLEKVVASSITDLATPSQTYVASHEFRVQMFVKGTMPAIIGARMWDLTAGNGPTAWSTATNTTAELAFSGTPQWSVQNGSAGTARTVLLRNFVYGPLGDSVLGGILARAG